MQRSVSVSQEYMCILFSSVVFQNSCMWEWDERDQVNFAFTAVDWEMRVEGETASPRMRVERVSASPWRRF